MRVYQRALAVLFAACLPALTYAQNGMVKKNAETTALVKTEVFHVVGNCGMCKSTIEKAAAAAGAIKASWDMSSDMLTVTFDPEKCSADAIQLAVARAGYDNVGYKAPDQAYNGLHGCCKYDRSEAPDTAKPVPAESNTPKQ